MLESGRCKIGDVELFLCVLGTARTWRAVWVTGEVVKLIVERSKIGDEDADEDDK